MYISAISRFLLASLVILSAEAVIVVQNGCPFAIHLAAATGGIDPQFPTGTVKLQPHGQMSFGRSTRPGLTESIFVSRRPSSDPDFGTGPRPMEFEYNVQPDGRLWFDMSLLNGGDPFRRFGWSIHPDTDACNSIVCSPHQRNCTSTYYPGFTVDPRIVNCNVAHDITVTPCISD